MRSGTTGVGSQVSTCDDCGPCGVQTVLTTQLTSGDYWLVIPCLTITFVVVLLLLFCCCCCLCTHNLRDGAPTHAHILTLFMFAAFHSQGCDGRFLHVPWAIPPGYPLHYCVNDHCRLRCCGHRYHRWTAQHQRCQQRCTGCVPRFHRSVDGHVHN